MHQGYIKFYRKAQDSASWNRGLLYQGLMVNFLTRANWKKATFQGIDLEPGQFAMSMTNLSVSLDVPRTTLQRMVAHLEADDFVKVLNVGNRFLVFTIVNWHSYQQSENESGQQMGDRWSTTGQQMGTYKEDKNINTHSLRECCQRQEPLTSPDKVQETGEQDKCPECDYRKIMEIYHEILPELPRIKAIAGTRQRQMRTRWRETWQRLKGQGEPCTAEFLLNWWRKFFTQVRHSDWLMGRSRDWSANFDFLVSPKGYLGVWEGKYNNRQRSAA